MTSKFIGIILGMIMILVATTPIYASNSNTASFQWTDDTFRLEGYQTDENGAILPDIIAFYSESDGITEINVGGGYNWRLNSHSSVLAEGYLVWRDNKDLSTLLLVSPSFRYEIGDYDCSVVLPVMRYFGDGSDDSTILARPRAWIEVSPGIRLGMIMKGSIPDEGNIGEIHGPYMELPGFPDDECLLQVGMYNLGGSNPKLEARLICTTN